MKLLRSALYVALGLYLLLAWLGVPGISLLSGEWIAAVPVAFVALVSWSAYRWGAKSRATRA